MARLIAFYLPQFHPIPENDRWWGRGFTEWTNTAKAKPLFPGHYQPHVPADLGFYDLRVPETRVAQASMAREYGVEAFCYYHYWFAGKRILERPFDEVLRSGEPDFPFCLCWANQTWTGIWHGEPNRVLIEQTYPGEDDHRRHFETLLPAFLDRRYVRVDDKPVFVIFQAREFPDPRAAMDLWREMAVRAGLPGLHLIGTNTVRRTPTELGLDATVSDAATGPAAKDFETKTGRMGEATTRGAVGAADGIPIRENTHTAARTGGIVDELSLSDSELGQHTAQRPQWARSPRRDAGVVQEACTRRPRAGSWRPHHHNLVFIKAWNEWAEGNHLEPDLRFEWDSSRPCVMCSVRHRLRKAVEG